MKTNRTKLRVCLLTVTVCFLFGSVASVAAENTVDLFSDFHCSDHFGESGENCIYDGDPGCDGECSAQYGLCGMKCGTWKGPYCEPKDPYVDCGEYIW